MCFRSKADVARFNSHKLEFDARLPALAIAVGAAANADYSSGVAVFTLVKGGLMHEAPVGGQAFSFTPR